MPTKTRRGGVRSAVGMPGACAQHALPPHDRTRHPSCPSPAHGSSAAPPTATKPARGRGCGHLTHTLQPAGTGTDPGLIRAKSLRCGPHTYGMYTVGELTLEVDADSRDPWHRVGQCQGCAHSRTASTHRPPRVDAPTRQGPASPRSTHADPRTTAHDYMTHIGWHHEASGGSCRGASV